MFHSGAESLEKWIALLSEALFELSCAVAFAARPGFLTIQVAAISTGVRVLHAEQVEIFFPVRAFLREWRRAKANLYPSGGPIFTQPGVFHVPKIFIASDGAVAKRLFFNGAG